MEIKELLEKSKSIWGEDKLNLSQIIVRTGKVFGDICRWERNSQKDKETHNDYELKKELGNMIFCNIRWCDDLGYDPQECIELAIKAQEKFVQENNKNS
ncbi:MAG: hypothetical protein WC682_01525 [Parcubacteria group bacterium]|jgi:hypothetical protein